MTNIVASSKQRLVSYLEFKGVNHTSFFSLTGIKRGFLDSDKLKSSISDVFLAKIIAEFPELNLIWLITGKGDMEIINRSQDFSEEEALINKINKFKKLFAGDDNDPTNKKLDHIIDMLEDKLEYIKDTIDTMSIRQSAQKALDDVSKDG